MHTARTGGALNKRLQQRIARNLTPPRGA